MPQIAQCALCERLTARDDLHALEPDDYRLGDDANIVPTEAVLICIRCAQKLVDDYEADLVSD